MLGVKLLQSPTVTPIKPLPFSPSQFLNSPSLNLSFDITLPASTPVRNQTRKVCLCFFELLTNLGEVCENGGHL